jgi:hypothetical protein
MPGHPQSGLKKVVWNEHNRLSLSKINHLFNVILNKEHMKAKKYFLTATGFFAGMIAGVSLIGLVAFSGGPSASAPGSGVASITLDVARSYFAKYMADAAPLNAPVKGFTIDKAQLDAMNLLIKENADLAGFRIYMGKDNTAKKIGIVVGVDAAGKDATKNTIYGTDSQQMSPCPLICDVTSPITQEK